MLAGPVSFFFRIFSVFSFLLLLFFYLEILFKNPKFEHLRKCIFSIFFEIYMFFRLNIFGD
jgi:hypothetical protein